MQAANRLPIETPVFTGASLTSGQLDFDVHARGKVELHQRIDRLRGGLHDVEQPLVGTHLELLGRLFVDMRTAVHGEFFDARRQRDRTANECARATCRVGDVGGGLIEHAVIKGLQANANILRFHDCSSRIPSDDAKEPKWPASTSIRKSNGHQNSLSYKPRESLRIARLAALYYFV